MKKKNKVKLNFEQVKISLRKMKRSIIFMENHLNNNFGLNEHYHNSEINPIFVRNVQYVNKVVQRVKENFNVMRELDRTNPENKLLIKKKFIISMVLMKHVNDLVKNNSFENEDFEVNQILFKDGKKPDFMKHIPEKYSQAVKEEFDSLENKKIIEGFSLGAIPKFFSMIGKAFVSIIEGIVKIGEFIGTMLVKFIELMWKLIMFTMDLIFKIIPAMVMGFLNFVRLLFLKTMKIGLFTVFLMMVICLGMMKYFENLLEMNGVPTPVVLLPAVFMTLYLFWFKTNMVWQMQVGLINGIVWMFTGPIRTIFQVALGLPKNDPFFRYRGNNGAKKTELFFLMITKNLAFIIIRFFLLILGSKYFVLYVLPMIMKSLPTFKELLIFPIIFARYVYIYLLKVWNIIFGSRKKID